MSEHEYGPAQPNGVHIMRRGASRYAGQLVRTIIANHDDRALTAHDVAAQAHHSQLPDRVRRLLDRRTSAVNRRCAAHQSWQTDVLQFAQSMEQT